MPDTAPGGKSKAKRIQELSMNEPAGEQDIRATIRLDTGFEICLVRPESVIRGILDPDVADCFIEVPIPDRVQGVLHRFIHTSRIKEIDLHDEVQFKLPG